LIGKALDYHGIHTFLLAEIVHILLEVILQELKNQDQFSICVDDLAEIDDVDVVELLQDGDFPDCCRGNALLL
jgi:hypothetical protein